MDSDASSAEKQIKKINDYDFSPCVDMMVHDHDDERTLDEEEALGESEDPQVELSNLEKERDMPLEALLALYPGYNNPSEENSTSNCSEEVNENLVIMEDKKEGKDISPFEGEEEEEDDDDDEEEEDKPEPSELQQLYNDIPPENSMPVRSLRSVSRPQSEEEEDYDYSPDEEEWKKTIMVGTDYQAWIPEGLCKYDDALPYENEDKLLWNPLALNDDDIESYLVKAQEPLFNNAHGVNAIPMGAHTRDDEQALYLLLQCGYNIEEALRRRRMNVVAPTDTMSLWSEEECRNFENGLRTYGKDFHQIQQHKVRTRSVGELVQFYYLWKKTERHDIFANKARLEKKKYTLHPGITDYMDRFLEDQESGGGTGNNFTNVSNVQRDRSTSPNIHCLIYGDPKRQQRVSELTKDKLESLITFKTSGSLACNTTDLIEGTLSFNQASSLLPSETAITINHTLNYNHNHTHASETLAQ